MKLSFSSLGILALLSISIFSNLNVCQAEVVWSDDFNDGDFEEWSVSSGIWSVINGTLQGQTITEGSYCIINKTSTIAYGTWSFDVKLQNEKNLYLSFIDYNSTFATFGYYYELQIRPRTSSVRFSGSTFTKSKDYIIQGKPSSTTLYMKNCIVLGII